MQPPLLVIIFTHQKFKLQDITCKWVKFEVIFLVATSRNHINLSFLHFLNRLKKTRHNLLDSIRGAGRWILLTLDDVKQGVSTPLVFVPIQVGNSFIQYLAHSHKSGIDLLF